MAMFRQFQTSFWSDNYIGDLSPNEKLLYIYILTNEKTGQSGVYEFNFRYAQFETGLSRTDIEQMINKFVKDGKVKYNKDYDEILVINWLKHNSARSPKVATVVDKEIRDIKTPEFESEVIMRSEALGYPITTKLPNSDTVSIPYGYPKDTVPIGYEYSTDSGSQYNIKEDKKNINIKEVEEQGAPAPADAYEIYQQNFGQLNSFNMQSISEWIKDFGSDELVIEAMKRAALESKGYRYAEGIMKSWAKSNVTTIKEAEAQDVAHDRNKKSYGNTPVVKGTLPEWAEEGYKPKAPEPVEEPELTPGLIAEMHRVREIEKKRLEALKNESD